MRIIRCLLASLAVAIALAACTATAPARESTTTLDLRLKIAPLDEVPPGGVMYVEGSRIYLVDSPDAGLIALYEEGPHLGCRIQLVGLGGRDNSLVTFDETRFVDPCHGSQYDMSGLYLGGPSPRSLDRVPIVLVGEDVYFEPVTDLIRVPRPPALKD